MQTCKGLDLFSRPHATTERPLPASDYDFASKQAFEIFPGYVQVSSLSFTSLNFLHTVLLLNDVDHPSGTGGADA